jgi:hypothetical protein
MGTQSSRQIGSCAVSIAGSTVTGASSLGAPDEGSWWYQGLGACGSPAEPQPIAVTAASTHATTVADVSRFMEMPFRREGLAPRMDRRPGTS